MNQQFLPFEQPLAEIEEKIKELRLVGVDSDVNVVDEIKSLEKKHQTLCQSIYSKLTPWQVTQMARHPLRPHTSDYIDYLFGDFDELHGDRHFSIGPAIIGGIGILDSKPVLILGHEKGRKVKDKVRHNFGMARPEDYRKALRLMRMAEKFSLPIITFIDTPGAYPGIGAEERNQSEAIAKNLLVMSQLKTPIITIVIGEGGSGGALAIGVADKLLMLQYSIYSVISPEGCASILWKSADKAPEAAQAMDLTAEKLFKHQLIDRVIPEPIGGAHRNLDEIAERVKAVLCEELTSLQHLPLSDLLQNRYQRYRQIGFKQ